MGKIFEDEMKKLQEIKMEAQGRGSTEFYDELQKKLETLSEPWEKLYAQEELSSEEIVRLIESKYNIIEYMEKLKEQE